MDKIKILVVDDESRMRKLVHDFLARKGMRYLRPETARRHLIYFISRRT